MRIIKAALIGIPVATFLAGGCAGPPPPGPNASTTRVAPRAATPQARAGGRPGPAVPPSEVRGVRISYGSGAEPPPSLSYLVCVADTIVIGSAGEVLRVARTPPNSDSGFPHTVFAVAVERYLRSDGAPGQPRSLKVYLRGGVIDGWAQVRDGAPLLTTGDRYLLFLRGSGGRDHWAMSGGTWGISFRRDEFGLAVPTEAMIRLVQGRTDVPQDGFQVIPRWRFEKGGDTLLGLTEEEACNQVLWSLSKLPRLTGDQQCSDLR